MSDDNSGHNAADLYDFASNGAEQIADIAREWASRFDFINACIVLHPEKPNDQNSAIDADHATIKDRLEKAQKAAVEIANQMAFCAAIYSRIADAERENPGSVNLTE